MGDDCPRTAPAPTVTAPAGFTAESVRPPRGGRRAPEPPPQDDGADNAQPLAPGDFQGRGGPGGWRLIGPDGRPVPGDTPLNPQLIDLIMDQVVNQKVPTESNQRIVRNILTDSMTVDNPGPGHEPATVGQAMAYSRRYLDARIAAERLYKTQIEPALLAGRQPDQNVMLQMDALRVDMARVMGVIPGSDGQNRRNLANSELHNDIMKYDRFAIDTLKVMTMEQWARGEASNPAASVGLGNEYLSRGRPQDAIAAASRAIEQGGGAGAFALRAAANNQVGDYAAAIRDAQQALSMDPSNKQALGALKLSEGRGADSGAAAAAAAAGGGALGGSPSSGRGFLGGGQGSSGQFAFAGAARNPGTAAAVRFNDQGRQALRLGDNASALDYARRSIGSDPNNPAAYLMMAQAYARMGKWKDAADAAKKGLELDPKDKSLQYVGARALLANKDYKGAAELANRAIEADPRAAWAFAARGYAMGGMGDRAGGLADLKQAASIDAGYAAAYDAALRTPQDEDLSLLFAGDPAPEERKGGATGAGRGRSFGLVSGAAAVGGLLLALGLLTVVGKPLVEGTRSVFTKLTRRGPSTSDSGVALAAAPAVAGLLRGQYEVGRQIGAGGMGLVFDGTDRSLNRRVAIKRMRDEIRLDPRERARFVAEAKTVAGLHHPNIVDIYAIVEDADDLHLVFEFVDGRTVSEMISGQGRFQPADALKVVQGAAAALDFAHGRGVIHRDMKPSNLMLDKSGRLKVMDFGIARAAKDLMTRAAMTNTVVGTPPYMAPEQEQGQVRKESDVYALSVCAYELLTGRLPFPGVGAGMLMNKINLSYVPPSKMAEHLPPALDEVFARAFQPDPDKRYRTAGEFSGALEAALSAAVRA